MFSCTKAAGRLSADLERRDRARLAILASGDIGQRRFSHLHRLSLHPHASSAYTSTLTVIEVVPIFTISA